MCLCTQTHTHTHRLTRPVSSAPGRYTANMLHCTAVCLARRVGTEGAPPQWRAGGRAGAGECAGRGPCSALRLNHRESLVAPAASTSLRQPFSVGWRSTGQDAPS